MPRDDAAELAELAAAIEGLQRIALATWPTLHDDRRAELCAHLGRAVDVLVPPRPVAKVFPIRGIK